MIKEFKNILEGDVSDSNIIRKLTGKLTVNETALRSSRLVVDSITKSIDDYTKGRLSADQFAKVVVTYHKDLKETAKLIKKAEKK